MKPLKPALQLGRRWAMPLGVLALISQSAFGEIIPASGRTEWSLAGVPDGIPYRTNIYTTLAAGTASSAINSAIASCPAGQVVKLGPGNFSGNLSFGWKNNITLRGSVDANGRPTTIINIGSGGAGIDIGGNSLWDNATYPPDWSVGTAITAGLGKGSSNLTVASASEFVVGVPVRIDQANNPTNIWNGTATNTIHNTAQNSRITAINGSVISIWPPLLYNFDANYSPRLKSQSYNGTPFYIQGVGLEDVRLVFTNGSATIGIQMQQAYACWLRNVQITNCPNYSLMLVGALQCSIVDCEIRNTPSHGPNHFGIGLERAVGWCLVQNNIVDQIFPNLEVNDGSSGNVVAYNYFGDAWQDDFGMGVSMNMNHGPGNLMNLYEGNVVATYLQSDGYFGGSFGDVIFRNRTYGYSTFYGTTHNRCIVLNRWTAYPTVVGNVSGTAGVQTGFEATAAGLGNGFIYQFGYPNMGNDEYSGTVPPNTWHNTGPNDSQYRDLNVRSTMLLHLNYDTVTATNRGIVYGSGLTETNLSNSLYLSAKPGWFGNRPWPPIDPANPSQSVTTNLPAGYRFAYGVDPPSGPDVTPPTAPTALTAVAAGTNQINLSWSASTDDVGVTGYRIERSQGAGSTNFIQAGTSVGSSFTDTARSSATVYNYRVRATDAAGNLGGFSNVATATTQLAPPTNLRVISASPLNSPSVN